MARSDSKKSKSTARKPKATAGAPKSPPADAAAEPTGVPAADSAFKLNDKDVEKYLVSGEHSGVLEDYFGEETYRELRKLAQEASARSVRGGPRVLIIPGIMGSKIGRKGRI
ncbi:MAG: hypothetical protein GY950_26765, partial [bacterium]|nr:hypothetical protein [bacterium]